MRKNSSNRSGHARTRGFYIVLAVGVAIIAAGIIINIMIANKNAKDVNTFDSSSWQSAVEQANGESVETASEALPQNAKPASKNDAVVKYEEDAEGMAETTSSPNPVPSPLPTPISDQTIGLDGKAALSQPVSGDVIKEHSGEDLVYSETMKDWRVHQGIDYAAEQDSDVHAAADGTVEKVYNDNMYGTSVVVDHGGGIKTLYANLKDTSVSEGDKVKTGQAIAKVGSTATAEVAEPFHLHFEVIDNEISQNPREYFKDESGEQTE